MKFNQINKKSFNLFSIAAACAFLLVNVSGVLAQFTFPGDFDKSFAAPNGYYVEPQNNDPTIPSDPARTSVLFTGYLNPDGSFVAGGRILLGDAGDFWLRKFTATGAIDMSFGGGAGYVRTEFFSRQVGQGYNNVLPQVLKPQPDGKILFAGGCSIPTSSGNANNASFGSDVCLVRYNADGTLDQTFGNFPVTVGYGAPCNSNDPNNPCTYNYFPGPGKFTMQTGNIFGSNSIGGTGGVIYDIALQPDGKIILAGETIDYGVPNAYNGRRYVGILIRLNPNGSVDATFGANGIARYVTDINPTRFRKVLVQADGRILAAGYDGRANGYHGFFVSRWTASGAIENTYSINNTTGNETAAGLLVSRDGTKVFVSGFAQNNQVLARLNIGNLSPDATFGNGGVKSYSYYNGGFDGLAIKAIQPDGKILANDRGFTGGNTTGVVRLNADGSPDQSFGNAPFSDQFAKGRLALQVQTYDGLKEFETGHLLLRPDGKLNLIGSALIHAGLGIYRGAVSQNLNVFKSGIYSDFTNDGKSDVSVFRSSTGAWYYLNSANNSFNGVSFGQAGDLPVPADYDGDGKTDVAVFRSGTWYLLQSTKGFVGISFGASGDLPRPGDFDGDGQADICVFRPSSGTWFYLRSSDNQTVGVTFGINGDVPLLADFDGDGKSDIAVFRQGFWYYLQSSNGAFRAVQFGAVSDVPTVGDYDGDSKSDVSIFRESNGIWYRINSSTNAFAFTQFGRAGDKAVPGDYDNDSKTDVAVFRAGVWYALRSGNNSVLGVAFGAASDVPVPAAYQP